MLDRLLQPFEQVLTDAVAASAPKTVLDVGCGTGATTLAIARRLGTRAQCTGADISRPMIALARERAASEGLPVDFIEADAQTFDFGKARFDMLVSRMGVMFFGDPLRAFANLRAAAAPNAVLQCIVWRSAEENPFMTTAERAVAHLLPALPPRQPDEPGQFAFADPQRVTHILEQSGWRSIDIRPVDAPSTMSEQELHHYIGMMGPVGIALRQESEQVRHAAMSAMRTAFAPYVADGVVRYSSACWQVSARAA
jgi:SAM-dependent methyltransferase